MGAAVVRHLSASISHPSGLRCRGRLRDFGVAEELTILAMNGDEVLRPDKIQDQFELFGASVTGNVHRRE